jgi:hypothetical protein
MATELVSATRAADRVGTQVAPNCLSDSATSPVGKTVLIPILYIAEIAGAGYRMFRVAFRACSQTNQLRR